MLEILGLSEKLISIADKVFGSVSKYKSASKEDRRRLADLFERIAVCVAEIGKSMGHKLVPKAHCSEIYAYSIELPEIMEKYVSPKLARELAEDLQAVYDTEEIGLMLQAESTELEWKALVSTAEAAAGKFRAAAHLLRAI